MSNPCNCYYGEDCTKTTVCAINAALEDQAEALETALTEGALKDAVIDAVRYLAIDDRGLLLRGWQELGEAMEKLDSASGKQK